jgi:hypothetical protein
MRTTLSGFGLLLALMPSATILLSAQSIAAPTFTPSISEDREAARPNPGLSAQTNPGGARFSLTIRALKPEVISGSDVGIEIKLTNTSEEPLTLALGHHGGLPDGYKWEVQDQQGEPLAKSGKRSVQLPNGQTWQVSDRAAGSAMNGQIGPGKSILQGATISSAFPFDRPGKYKIRVWRPANPGTPDAPESEKVYSNSITISVLPKPEEVQPK